MGTAAINYAQHSALVIDDQPFVRKTVVHLLKQLGIGAIGEAQDGESGLQECARLNPDFIVCDIDMVPVNGLEFLNRLRTSTTVRNPRVPVIFLTVHSESEVVRKAMDLNVNAFVVKPPTLPTLKERIDRFLSPP